MQPLTDPHLLTHRIDNGVDVCHNLGTERGDLRLHGVCMGREIAANKSMCIRGIN